MSVLTDDEISEFVREKHLISDFSKESLEGASYDMRVGRQYVRQGVIEPLNDEHPTLVLQPGDFVVLRSHEELNMPLDMVGHNGIMSPWAKRGLVSLFSPQIDPGFEGFLTVPVFNAGDAPISINYMDKIFTVEFVRTSRAASYGWSAKHGRQSRMVVPVAPSSLRPNLADVAIIQQELKETRQLLEAIKSKQLANEAELKVTQAQISSQQSSQLYIVTKWTLIVGIGALLVGVVASDWLRTELVNGWKHFMGGH